MQAEIDEGLIREIRRLAEEQGRPERELLDEAVRRYLDEQNPGSLEELFEEAAHWQRERGVKPLSDEEAMRLADKELHAMRRERRATP